VAKKWEGILNNYYQLGEDAHHFYIAIVTQALAAQNGDYNEKKCN
jgi:hypothetical protein